MIEYNYIDDTIFTLDGIFTVEECDAAIHRTEVLGYEAATINTAFGPAVRPDVRNNGRVILDDFTLAADLWTRVHDYLPATRPDWHAVGLNERFRFYRYEVGQQFDWHADGYFERASGERSFWTFMVYLNDDFDGGETSFNNVRVKPRQGMALVFLHPLLHKGEPVRRGRKYVLRSDIMFARRT